MTMYTVEVNGTPTLVFESDWSIDVVEIRFEDKYSDLQIALQEHVGCDGRPLFQGRERVSFRLATSEEIQRWQASMEGAEADWRSEGWNDFERDDFIAFLVAVKSNDWDENNEGDGQEAA